MEYGDRYYEGLEREAMAEQARRTARGALTLTLEMTVEQAENLMTLVQIANVNAEVQRHFPLIARDAMRTVGRLNAEVLTVGGPQ
jgi:hypothetical protein